MNPTIAHTECHKIHLWRDIYRVDFGHPTDEKCSCRKIYRSRLIFPVGNYLVLR